MSLFNKIEEQVKNLFSRNEEEQLETPQNEKLDMRLEYKALIVGKLLLKDGKWIFEYSDEFKTQNEIPAIPDFPDKFKTYSNEHLFPFFMQRIPGTSQPKVREEIEKEKINATNVAELLRHFGKISISNPFRLEVA